MSQNIPSPTLQNIPIWEKLGIGTTVFAYAMILGGAYLFSFWRPIGFDIFPYLTLQNYISLAINRVVVLVLFPAIFAVIFFTQPTTSQSPAWHSISFHLCLVYFVGFIMQQFKAINLFLKIDFYYTNELAIFIISTLLIIAAITICIASLKRAINNNMKVASVIFAQSAVIIPAGYCDGKAIHDNASNVFFLENKELCEKNKIQDWVYLGKYGEQTFFISNLDKKICLSSTKDFNLISKKLKEHQKPTK